MKTAESIEAQEERKLSKSPGKHHYRRGKNPKSHTLVGNRNGTSAAERIRAYQWQPGQSGNPLGKQQEDVAATIAKQVFANNREQLYKAYARAALKGNAYAFKELADRAFGKVTEKVSYEISEYREVSEKALIERVRQLEQSLGFRSSCDGTGGAADDQSGTPQTTLTKTN